MEYYYYILQFSVAFILTLALVGVITALSKSAPRQLSKSSPFECGFTPKLNSRLPFSTQFFLIALIFLVFDVEVVILYPIMCKEEFSKATSLNYVVWFLLLLAVGLAIEWSQASLEWLK